MTSLFPNGCIVCGHRDFRVRYKSTVPSTVTSDSAFYIPTYNKAMLHGEISTCQGCGFIFVSDRPSAEVYERVYSGMEDAQYLGEASAYKMSFQFVLSEIEPHRKNGNVLLEVGCGSGFFLEEAKKRGWDIYGIELSKWMAEQAGRILGSGVVVQGGFEKEHPKRSAFDVVVAIHVIEHVTSPVDFLKSMSKRLAPGGVLYLVTPDIGSWLARILGEKWWYIQIPHIYYFDSKSIRRILEDNGFEVVKIRDYPRIVSREILSNRIDFLPRLLRPLARVLFFPFLLFPWTVRFNTGDQIAVMAKKKAA